jgi:hypothetical protein
VAGEPTSPDPHPLAYHAQRSGRTVTVAWCADLGEAELVCSALRGSNVPAAVFNQHTAALGPYAGGSRIQVKVPVEDGAAAAEVLARLPWLHDVEPEPEPADGSAEFAVDDRGGRVALAVVGEFASAQDMLGASAALGSVRIRAYLPNLVPRDLDAHGPPPPFRVRVAKEDLSRARSVLEESAEPDEPRCPKCGAWRVHRHGRGLVAWLAGLFVPTESADGVQALECLRCGHRFAWGNPKGTFEVVVRPDGTTPPAPGR